MKTFNKSTELAYNRMRANVVDRISAMFPIDTRKYTVTAKNFRWIDSAVNDLKPFLTAKLRKNTLATPLRAHITVKDKKGKVVYEDKDFLVTAVPKMTPLGSYVVNGSDVQTITQARRKPGIYTSRMPNDNILTRFSTAGGEIGIMLDRLTRVFKVRVRAKFFPLYSIAAAAGVTDEELRKAWGDELYRINKQKAKPLKDQQRFWQATRRVALPTDASEISAGIKAFLESKPLDPKVTKLTVGEGFDAINARALVAASEAALKVQQGKREVDDMESLAYKNYYGIEDFVSEALDQATNKIRNHIAYLLDRTDNAKRALSPELFTQPIMGEFTQSEFSRFSSQNNPLDILATDNLVTITGRGGIQNHHAITEGLRAPHSTHLGFYDPTHTPEGCHDSETEVFTDKGWVKWPDVTENTSFACLMDGDVLEYHKAEELQVYDWNQPLYGFKSKTIEYLVTANHRMWVRPDDSDRGQGLPKYRFEAAEAAHLKPRKVRCGGHLAYYGKLVNRSTIRLAEVQGGSATKQADAFDIEDWAEFLGWYISEGSTWYKPEIGKYAVQITQRLDANPENVARIAALLDRMRLPFSFSKPKTFSISRKQLAAYTKQFGKCDEKFLPEEVFEWPVVARERLLESLMLGDGRKGKTKIGWLSGSGYCTTSLRLAKDVERLCFGLGISTRTVFEPDERAVHYKGCWIIHLHVCHERTLRKSMTAQDSGYFMQAYNGKVYCATVPGHRLYCRRNGKGGFWSGNSGIGITTHMASGVVRQGQELKSPFFDVRNKWRVVNLTPTQLIGKVIAFPDQIDAKTRKFKTATVNVIQDDKQNRVRTDKVDYAMIDSAMVFDPITGMMPFLQNTDANRVLMSARHMEQAVPLITREAPLVSARVGDTDITQEQRLHYTGVGSRAPVAGEVTRVTAQKITITDKDGKKHVVPMLRDYPLNSEQYFTEVPAVKAGDKVKEGEILADNNFTHNGSLALGKNLTTVFMPYRGLNFEDGIVISETGAHKLSSEHKHELQLELAKNVLYGVDKLFAIQPDAQQNYDSSKFDEKGLPKVGAKFHHGEILLPAVREVKVDPTSEFARIHKKLRNPYRDASIVWEEPVEGEVVHVAKTSKFVSVLLKTIEAAQVGDKLSSRNASKGIITAIIPDKEAPHIKGEPVDVIFNPFGVPGRVNPGLFMEAAASKIADKTGQPYLIRQFDPKVSMNDQLISELKKHKLSDTEEVTDPLTETTHSDVLTGKVYWGKLKHHVRKKFSARGLDHYTLEERPGKGHHASAQTIGALDTYALLAHGVPHVMTEFTGLKANRNDEYWNALQTGAPLPAPKRPFVLTKFETYLRGSGINLKREGTKIKALPLTDKDVTTMSQGKIKNPLVVNAKSLNPERGGLFDEGITGGFNANNWNHIDLAEPVPNPLYEVPIVTLTGIKKTEYESILAGQLYVTRGGTLGTRQVENAVTGGAGIKRLLEMIDVAREYKKAKAQVLTAKKADLARLYKKLKYLTALKDLKLTPVEAYVMHKMPVVPTSFRPVTALPDGSLNVADINHGYREVLMVNDQLKKLKQDGIDDEHLVPLRRGLYGAVSGTIGLTEPLTRSANFKGFISTIAGRQNKSGMFQGQLVSRRQDLSGRSTVIPEPTYGMDEVGLPREMVYTIYRPLIVRELVTTLRVKPLEARKLIEENDPRVAHVARELVKLHPVLLNRAPTLHKFSIMGLKPRIIEGKAIKVNPLIINGMNMDFDGDSSAVHPVISLDARQEVLEKMLPSKNLMSPRDRQRIVPNISRETVLGLWMMTRPVYPSDIQIMHGVKALRLIDEGKTRVNTRIMYRGKPTTPGFFLVRAAVPAYVDMDPGKEVTGKMVEGWIQQIAKKSPSDAARVLNDLKNLGNYYVSRIGYSVSLNDMSAGQAERDRIMRRLVRNLRQEGMKMEVFQRGIGELNKLMKRQKKNRLVQMVNSGALSKADAMRKMILPAVAVTDYKGKVVPLLLEKSYAQGMPLNQWWATVPGARKGLADKGLSTADTGAFTKELMNTAITQIIREHDCGTTGYIEIDRDDPHILGRTLATGSKKGQQITADMVKRLPKKVKVRSPLKCQSKDGICQLCYGLDEHNALPVIGRNIGVVAAHTISEPATQLTLKAFHTSGSAGVQQFGFDRVKQVFSLPENIKGKAILALEDDKVTELRRSPLGGHDIITEKGHSYYCDTFVGTAVKKGQKIKKGQQLSERGTLKIQEVAELRGIETAQKQLVNDMHAAYAAGGVHIDKKIFETVARPMATKVKVTNPGDGEFKYNVHEGDTYQSSTVENWNKTLSRKIEFEPIVMGMNRVPFVGEDFIAPLMYQRLPRTLTQAPAMGMQTDIVTGHVIPSHVFGTLPERAQKLKTDAQKKLLAVK